MLFMGKSTISFFAIFYIYRYISSPEGMLLRMTL